MARGLPGGEGCGKGRVSPASVRIGLRFIYFYCAPGEANLLQMLEGEKLAGTEQCSPAQPMSLIARIL